MTAAEAKTTPVEVKITPVEVNTKEVTAPEDRKASECSTDLESQPAGADKQPKDVETSLQAWICVLGSFCFSFSSFGFMSCVGTLQTYLQEHQLSAYSSSSIGWITGVYIFLGLFLGIQIGPMMDSYGPQILAPAASGLTIPMFFLLAECKVYWHFMACLGVLGGIAGAIATTVAISVCGKLFVRNRGLAIGLSISGSSMGAVVFPIMLRDTLESLGYQWAIRCMAFVVLAVMIVGNLCYLPFPSLIRAKDVKPSKGGAVVNFAAFSSPAFSLVTVGAFLIEFVMFGVTGILPTYVAVAGFPAESGFVTIAILNGMSCLGRIVPGIAGDKFGHLNVFCFAVVSTVVFIGALLMPFGSKNISVLYAFSGLWGFGSGSFITIAPVVIGKVCEPEEYGRYYGTLYFVVSFAALITVPIGGKMLDSMGTTALSAFYLAMVLLGGCCFYAVRVILTGKWFAFRVKV